MHCYLIYIYLTQGRLYEANIVHADICVTHVNEACKTISPWVPLDMEGEFLTPTPPPPKKYKLK